MLTGVDHTPKIDLDDLVKGFGGDFGDWRIAALDADPYIVVQYIDPSPSVGAGRHHPLHIRLNGDVGGMRHCFTALAQDQVDCLLRCFQISVDGQHLRPLARKQHGGGAAITDGGGWAWALSRSDDDGDLIFQTVSHDVFLISLTYFLAADVFQVRRRIPARRRFQVRPAAARRRCKKQSP